MGIHFNWIPPHGAGVVKATENMLMFIFIYLLLGHYVEIVMRSAVI